MVLNVSQLKNDASKNYYKRNGNIVMDKWQQAKRYDKEINAFARM